MSVNEDAFDLLVSHRLALLRYEAGTARDLAFIYEQAFDDLNAALDAARKKAASSGSLFTRDVERIQAALIELTARIREVNRVASLTMSERLSEVGEAERDFHAGRLSREIGVSFTAVPEATVAAAIRAPIGGGRWTDRLAVDLLEVHDALREVVARGIAGGGSMDRIAEVIGEATGIQEVYRNRLVAIARTEVQRVANDVALASYIENADIVGSVEWLATLDSRTCLRCAPLHATVYPLEAGRPVGLPARPPLHPRCRCFLAPVVRPYSELLGTPKRPPSDYTGRPALDTTFDAWLKRQSAATQTEVLGAARRELWLAGTPLGAFVDAGRVLRLGELRETVT